MEELKNYSFNPGALDTGGGFALGFASYGSGVGEAGALSFIAGATDGPAGGPTSYARWTVTTPKTSGSTGFVSNSATNRAPRPGGLAGDLVTASLWARYTGPGTTTVALRTYSYLGGTIVTKADKTGIVLTSGVWTRISQTITSAGAYDAIGWWMYQVSGQTLPAAATLDATGVLEGPDVPYFDGSTGRFAVPDVPYFDGSTGRFAVPEAPLDWYEFGWDGAPGLSASTRTRREIDAWTRRWWETLPTHYRQADAGQNPESGGYPMLRWMDGAGSVAGEFRTISDALWDGTYTDPATVPGGSPLRWLAQMMGAPVAQMSRPDADLRQYLVDLVAGGRAAVGTRRAIYDVAKYFLTGDRQVNVVPSPLPHRIVLLVRADELPGTTADLAAAVKASGAVPAGHVILVQTVSSTWDTWEAAAGSTWTTREAAAKTWAEADSLGVVIE